MNRIPATVVTGFLGAGKTSLMSHAVKAAKGRRLALVVNEFGETGVDGGILSACGFEGCKDEDIIELANGCICCTVADDFLPTIETLLGRDAPPDGILIETSGLALPKPLVKAFAWPEIKSRVTVDGVIAVIDARAVHDGRFADDPEKVAAQRAADPSLEHDNPLEEVFEDQLVCADLVILNKSDLLDEAALKAVETQLRAVLEEHGRKGVKIVATKHGAVPVEVLLGLEAAAEDDLANRPSHHETEDDHDHDDFESFSLPIKPVSDMDGLLATLAKLANAHDILRLKGFLSVPGRDLRHVVQGVGARLNGYYDRPWATGEARDGRLVIIGQKGLDRDGIARGLEGYLA
ncbi:MAG TPA: cobalamin biosynthesis protein CobW [Alphaproteobacteria bacterium]|nr:cobalamin biosynthesis protein CobW [Alphaproteobacteria bacterium]